MAVEFILDREQEKLEDELDQVLKQLREKPEDKKDSYVLAQFTKRLLEAFLPEERESVRLKPGIRPKLRKLKLLPQQLPKKSAEVFPVPYPGMPAPPEFKLEEIEIPEPPRGPPGVERKTLILDRETSQPLAEAEINDKEYRIIESNLSEDDVQVLIALENKLRSNPQKFLTNPNKLTKLTKKFCRKYGVAFTPDNYRKLRYHLIKELVNLSKIDPIFNDPGITLINCESAGKPITVEYQGRVLTTNIVPQSDEAINHIIKQLGRRIKVNIDVKNPLLEAFVGDKKVIANYGSDFAPANFKIEKAK
ncbi:MAG: hypothetical protein Q8R00_00740 [Candidatus Nanoarchaeia archaeon]|nr:hypothetical protein [Candidatus Nanoarchaeia archaeon]